MEYLFCTLYRVEHSDFSTTAAFSPLLLRKSPMQPVMHQSRSTARPAMCPTSMGISVLPAGAILLSFFLSPPRSQMQNGV